MSVDSQRASALVLQGFGVALGARVILADVSFELAPRSLTALFGPVGAGKSTLLRTLAGLNDGHPSLRVWGRASLEGAPLAECNRPALVTQSAKLMLGTVLDNILAHEPPRNSFVTTKRDRAIEVLERSNLAVLADRLDTPVVGLSTVEQRMLAIARTCVMEPSVLFVDEPTHGLSEDEAHDLLALLALEGTRRTVLFVTHRIDQAQVVAQQAVLLASGRVVEAAPSEAFFGAPKHELTRQFLRTGSCPTMSPDARPEELAEDVAPPPPLPESATIASRAEQGPRGFRWLVPSRLSGCARPGLMEPLDADLDALVRLGINVLVTLEESELPKEPLEARAIESVHVPVRDMHPPSVRSALELCESIDRWLTDGKRVCVHCRAGLGRTGTVLVAWLIFKGSSAPAALEQARGVERYWVESDAQLEFLSQFWEVVGKTT